MAQRLSGLSHPSQNHAFVTFLPLAFSRSLRIMVPGVFSGKWLGKSAGKLMSVVSFVVFLILDFLDTLCCIMYGILDEYFEGEATPCYCGKRRELIHDGEGKLEGGMSETLYARKNVFREMGFLGFPRKREDSNKRGGGVAVNRWSDCRCESCVSWMNNGDQKLHVIVRGPSKGNLLK